MIRILCAVLALCAFVSQAVAANCSYIDPGDHYYLNDWGPENRKGVVVRKLGGNSVKVRDVASGESSVVQADALLTKSELSTEETSNAVVGTAVGVVIMVCLLSPETCTDE